MGGRRGDGQISLPDESQPEFHGQGTRHFGPAFVFELSLYLLDVYLLKEFTKIDQSLQMDRVPVHIAAERGHSAIVDLLVDKCKASISARTKDGSTLMHIASQYGHPDTALTFLKKGVPLHMPNKV